MTGEGNEVIRSMDCHAITDNPPQTSIENGVRKVAFTLAEVLITLGIIGVVAVLTIPSVINNIKYKQFQAAFKSAYSIFSQAVMNMKQESGEEDLNSYYAKYDYVEKTYINAQEFYDKFYKYSNLNVIGKCYYENPIRNYNNTNDGFMKSLLVSSGSKVFDSLLSNGMCSVVWIASSRINIGIDVNGIKGPNRLGHDIFRFYIGEDNRLKPDKMERLYSEEELENEKYPYISGIPCSVNSKQAGNGLGCAYYALIDENPDDRTKSYWKSLP